MEKRKRIWFSITLGILFALIIIGIRIGFEILNKPVICNNISNYNDMVFLNFKGQKIDIFDTKNYKVIFSLSRNCSPCIESLVFIKRLIDLYGAKNVDFYNIWREGIPLSITRMYGIPDDINLKLSHNRYLTETTPICLILDSKGELILFVTKNDFCFIIDKLSDLGITLSKEDAIEYIHNYCPYNEYNLLFSFC